MSHRGQAWGKKKKFFKEEGGREAGGVGVVWGLESLSDEKQSEYAEGQTGRSLGIESLYFHCLAEHCHREDQTQDLWKNTQKNRDSWNHMSLKTAAVETKAFQIITMLLVSYN